MNKGRVPAARKLKLIKTAATAPSTWHLLRSGRLVKYIEYKKYKMRKNYLNPSEMQYSSEFHSMAFYSRSICKKIMFMFKNWSNTLIFSNGKPIDTQASLLFYSGHKMLFFLQTLLITFIPSRLTQLKMAYASYQKPFSHQEKRSLVRCEVLMVTFLGKMGNFGISLFWREKNVL